MNGQNVVFLEVTLIKLINIFTLNFEIVAAVWGFNFVSIVKYISRLPPMLGELYVRIIWYICLGLLLE